MTETSTTERLSGRCLCGAVTFTARPKPAMHACHCEFCRRWSGGVYLSIACEEIEVANPGAVGVYASSEWAERRFCRTCGSSLFWVLKDSGATAVSIQAFDDPAAFPFVDEIFIDSKPSSYDFAGDRPRKTGAEVFAEFAGGD